MEVEEDVLHACWVEYDSDLYLAIESYTFRVPRHEAFSESLALTAKEDQPRITASTYPADVVQKTVIDFKIPRFFNRLLADEEVYFEVPVTIGELWCVCSPIP